MVGAGVAGLLFMVSLNLGLMDSIKQGSSMIMICFAVVCILLGAIAGVVAFKFFQKYFVSIIGAIVAAVLISPIVPMEILPMVGQTFGHSYWCRRWWISWSKNG